MPRLTVMGVFRVLEMEMKKSSSSLSVSVKIEFKIMRSASSVLRRHFCLRRRRRQCYAHALRRYTALSIYNVHGRRSGCVRVYVYIVVI